MQLPLRTPLNKTMQLLSVGRSATANCLHLDWQLHLPRFFHTLISFGHVQSHHNRIFAMEFAVNGPVGNEGQPEDDQQWAQVCGEQTLVCFDCQCFNSFSYRTTHIARIWIVFHRNNSDLTTFKEYSMNEFALLWRQETSDLHRFSGGCLFRATVNAGAPLVKVHCFASCVSVSHFVLSSFDPRYDTFYVFHVLIFTKNFQNSVQTTRSFFEEPRKL